MPACPQLGIPADVLDVYEYGPVSSAPTVGDALSNAKRDAVGESKIAERYAGAGRNYTEHSIG